MPDFVHLHLHTMYSLLDGAIKLPELMEKVKNSGMESVAMTDHGTLSGTIDFYTTAKKYEVKPIIGIEAYITENRLIRANNRNHLVLLARNNTGYQNLLYLSSMAFKEGFYYKPRIDLPLLAQRSEGLIALTACLAGELPQFLMNNQIDKAVEYIKTYRKIFGDDGFYLEIQENGLAEQTLVNERILELAEHTGSALVATNDCHYLERSDAIAHDILLCIQTVKKRTDSERGLRHDTDAFYVKTPEEMVKSFAYAPEAVANTVRIAELCNVDLVLGKTYLPSYSVPGEYTLETYLRELAFQGLERRYPSLGYTVDRQVYEQRLDFELSVIEKMGYAGYFLIVWDFIKYAKDNDIPVGPGRGSGAGSLAAFATGITDIDPIRYNLLFERFLNPERVSLPDFDIDFCQDERQRVIEYVTAKYGKNNVAQIATFGALKAKAVVKDVGRALDFPYSEMDRISKLIPEDPKMTLERAIELNPEFAAVRQIDAAHAELIDISLRLEGLNRHMSIHPAGVVIADHPLWEYVPIYTKDNDFVTQFAKDEVEKVGLVKFDFLGISTLTLIANAVRRINKRSLAEPSFDIRRIPIDDQATFRLLTSGKTLGVFQVESQGFMELLKNLRPDCLEDIIAAVAIYRPGPLGSGMDKDFAKRKHGEVPIVYPHPKLETVLKETYGIIIYQEQVMQIAQILAGYSLGSADLLRRAMGKKKPEIMAEHRKTFVSGCTENGIDHKQASDIFDLMEKFAEYGFNKSHSAAYALITYQTAYLKAHHPLEFMAALLTIEEKADKVTTYIREVREMGFQVLPPDLNTSEIDFTVEQGAIRFGLGAIKNVGSAALESIMEVRGSSGPFLDLLDFLKRVDLRRVNRKVLESLVRSGAFDFTGLARAHNDSEIDRLIDFAVSLQKDIETGQLNMFDALASDGNQEREAGKSSETQVRIKQSEWPIEQLLRYEKELLGFYVSGHPLKEIDKELRRFGAIRSDQVDNLDHGSEATFIVLISEVTIRYNEKKEKWAIVSSEDMAGALEFSLYSSVYNENCDKLQKNAIIVLQAKVLRREQKTRIQAEQVEDFETFQFNRIRRVLLHSRLEDLSPARIQGMKEVIKSNHGSAFITLTVERKDKVKAMFLFPESLKVVPTKRLTESFRLLHIDVEFQ